MEMCRWHWAALCCCSPGNRTDTSQGKDKERLKCLCCVTSDTGNVNVNPFFPTFSSNWKGQFAPVTNWFECVTISPGTRRLQVDLKFGQFKSTVLSYHISQLFNNIVIVSSTSSKGKNAFYFLCLFIYFILYSFIYLILFLHFLCFSSEHYKETEITRSWHFLDFHYF